MSKPVTSAANRMQASPFADLDDQYRAVFDAVNDGIFISNPNTGRFIEVNQAGCQMFGYEKGELLNRDIGLLSSGIHPYTHEVAVDRSQIAFSGEPITFEWQCRNKEEGLFWAEVSLRITVFGRTPAVVANVRDITQRKAQHERFRQLADNIAEVFWMSSLDLSTVLYVSPAYETIWGHSCQSLYAHPGQWFEAIHEEDRERILGVIKRWDYGDYYEEFRIVRPDGEVRWIADRAFPLRDDNGSIYRIAGVAHDITERKKLSAKIEHMAHYDALTGLANRSLYTTTLNGAIAQSLRTGRAFAILALDLDHFKDVNDTRGHPVGDRLLQLVAERLRAGVRLNETVFRLGGDEFAVLLNDAREPADIAALAERLIASINDPFVIDGLEARVGTSIGISIYSRDACDADKLMSHADMALYDAKSHGPQTYRFYCDAMDGEVRSRIALTNELRLAIPSGQLVVAYQPQVAAVDGRIVGVEALVRWQHPRRGLLMPGAFLSVAEASGLIVELDQWVLREACRQARQWLDTGVAPATICVNLSSAHFNRPDELERFIFAVLDEMQLPARFLELEITERTLIGFTAQHTEMLERLRKAGIKVSLDDFGTGYSSLNYLRQVSFDHIKIAREFVSELASSTATVSIVKAIVAMARDLGSGVIAEGVETGEQLRLLREWGCAHIQGYAFSRPITPEAILPLLQAGVLKPATDNQPRR